MTTTDAQETWLEMAGHVPADRTIAIADGRVRAFAFATTVGVPRPQSEEFNNYWGPLSWAFDAVVWGGQDADAVVSEARAAMNKANGF